MNANKKIGLVKGRHDMPVSDFLFEEIADIFDFDAMDEKASERLMELFPEVSLETVACNASYTDTERYYRGSLDLYITGLSSALASVISACANLGIDLTLFHFNTATGEYVAQKMPRMTSI